MIVLLVLQADLRIHGFDYSEDGDHNIDCTVALIPQITKAVQRIVDLLRLTFLHHLLNYYWVRLVAHFEDVIWRDVVEAGVRGL
jgi:hypothetical protein